MAKPLAGRMRRKEWTFRTMAARETTDGAYHRGERGSLLDPVLRFDKRRFATRRNGRRPRRETQRHP